MPIRLIVTGGTFDKEYNELKGTLFFKDTHVPEMLELGRCQAQVVVETLFLVDSLDLTDKDRSAILNRCQSAAETKIVVTHGTDTMEKTAQTLGPAIKNKVVVLTGAMVPYKFGSSDGLFNLGSALAFAQTLPNGVYVAMNGRYFTWNNVHKDAETGEFVELGK